MADDLAPGFVHGCARVCGGLRDVAGVTEGLVKADMQVGAAQGAVAMPPRCLSRLIL
ncbi:hypothetical protein N7U49_46105 [Streptomyces sp. AD2-2]|nr:hypothetical protein N7U49_46105 [Streptomyces sp. AD2-2]